MSTTTLTCRDCGFTAEANDTDFAPSAKYASGYHSRCRSCLSEHRRKERRKKQDSMTDAEWQAHQAERKAYRKRYNAENSERIAAGRAASKAKLEIPKLIDELRRLHDARRARDLGPKWREWCNHARDAAMDRYGVPSLLSITLPDGVSEYTDPVAYARWEKESYQPYRAALKRMDSDPTMRFISEVDWTLTCREYCHGLYIDSRFEELRAKMEAFTAEEIHAALTHVPQPREAHLSPSTKRALRRMIRDMEKRKAALTDEQRAERQARWDELLTGEITEESLHAQQRENLRAREEGRSPDCVLESTTDVEQWGGLQRSIDENQQRAEALEAARKKRNKKRSERRRRKRELERKAAERKARKAEYEKQRRERLKGGSVDSPEGI